MTQPNDDNALQNATIGHIAVALTALSTKMEPVPGAIIQIQTTLGGLATMVQEHDTTLYGEKMESGLVGEVQSLKKELAALRGGLTWVGVAVGGLVISFLFGIFTGQIQVIFP